MVTFQRADKEAARLLQRPPLPQVADLRQTADERLGCAVTGRLSNKRRPTEPPAEIPRIAISLRSILPSRATFASEHERPQTVDGRTRVGFSDRASPSQLGAVPRPRRLSGRSSVRRRRRI